MGIVVLLQRGLEQRDDLTVIIRRLANSYYFQLNIAGDQYQLAPDQKHLIEVANENMAKKVRLVSWMDN